MLTDNRVYENRSDPYSNLYSNDLFGQSILGVIGLEPKIFLWDRISIGTQFGFQYTYTYSKYKYNYQYNDLTTIQNSTNNFFCQ